MGVRGQSSWLAHLGVHAERADVACVGFQREVANKPHAPRPFHLCPFPKGPGPHGDGSPYWYGMGKAGNLMPPFLGLRPTAWQSSGDRVTEEAAWRCRIVQRTGLS